MLGLRLDLLLRLLLLRGGMLTLKILLLVLRGKRREASASLARTPGKARTLRRGPATPVATRRRTAALKPLRSLLLVQLGRLELHELLLLLLRLLCQDDAASYAAECYRSSLYDTASDPSSVLADRRFGLEYTASPCCEELTYPESSKCHRT
jgi:hypothetical protein